MPRFYVKKNDKWNIFSSITDGFLYSDFMPFEELQAVVIGEAVVDKMKDLGTLLTSSPRLNTMSYEEAEEHIRARRLADAEYEGASHGRDQAYDEAFDNALRTINEAYEEETWNR